MSGNEMKGKTNNELLDIIRLNENPNIPNSQFQRAKLELELRDRNKAQNIPWYRSWWMRSIVYPVFCVFIGLIGGVILEHNLSNKNNPQSNFICPENYQDSKVAEADLIKFIEDYKNTHPQATIEDLVNYRYSLLIKYNCQKTLENIHNNN
jgi:hypothetical protein